MMKSLFPFNTRTFLLWFYPHRLMSFLKDSKIKKRQDEIRKSLKFCGSSVHFGTIGMINCPWCISVGDNTYFGNELYLTVWDKVIENRMTPEGGEASQQIEPELTIGANCNFGAYNHITCANRITIGDNVLTGKWVTITDNYHGDTDYESLLTPPTMRRIVTKGAVKIGNNVWIGDKATILSGVEIGEGSVVGANTVVTKNVPAYSVVVGNPFRIVKTYSCQESSQ